MTQGQRSDPDSELPTVARPPDPRGQTIAGYRVLQLVGEGGMGVVYEAEQETPVRRRVALKLIKPGMDTREVVARFESERQALALMSHPSIAGIYDGGATEDGRPYFAMELVHGDPLTEYCDRNRLTLKERLELFLQVCEGVQHAHQKGVIHRDIKPSNILVTIRDEKPVPKIIDFGVAKAISQPLTEKTLYTRLGQWMGTPLYMSPEQAEMSGVDVDTRTDVYSLGVVLYELLAGAQPYDPTELKKAGFEGLRRILREREPPRPSTKVHTLAGTLTDPARTRRLDLSALERELRGDLDWITLRALEKDRTRRYGSPSELAADIRRHLRHEPVVASPPSVVYRTRKFVRRHRVGVAFGSLAMAFLVAFAVAMTVQSVRVARERDRADREAEKAQAVNAFLLRVLAAANPRTGQGARTTILEGVDGAAPEIDGLLSEDPEVQAAVQTVIGRTYSELGRDERARALFESALRLRRETLGDRHPDVVESLNNLASLSFAQDRQHAEALLREAVSIGRTLPREDQAVLGDSLDALGFVLMSSGAYEDARALHEEALALFRELRGEESDEAYMVLHNMGVLEEYRGDFEAARSLYLKALRHSESKGLVNADVSANLSNVGWVLYEQGDFANAERRFRASASILGRVFAHPNQTMVVSWAELAMPLVSLEDYPEAADLFAKALEVDPEFARTLLETDPDRLTPRSQRWAQIAGAYGRLLVSQGRYEEAEARLLAALRVLERDLPPHDPRARRTRTFLAELFDAWGRPEEAEEYREESSSTPGS